MGQQRDFAVGTLTKVPNLPATYDVTARKTHQWTMVALIVVGFLLGEPRGAWPLLFAGAIMLVGRFWWPADLIVSSSCALPNQPAGFAASNAKKTTQRAASHGGWAVRSGSSAPRSSSPALAPSRGFSALPS